MKIIRIAQFDYLEEDEENKPPVNLIKVKKSQKIKISEMFFDLGVSNGNYSFQHIDSIDEVMKLSQDTVWVTKEEPKAKEFLENFGNMILIYLDGQKYAGTFEGWETIYDTNGFVLDKDESGKIMKCNEELI